MRGETQHGGVHREDVAGTGADLCIGIAVVDLVGTGVHGRQGLGRDVDGEAGGANQRVVAGRAAVDGQARDGDRPVVAGESVGQRARADAAGRQCDADHVTGNDRTGVHGGPGHVDRHRGGAVVDPVGGGDAGDPQRTWRDAGRGAGRVGQQAVVGGLGTGQRDVADGHGPVRAHRAVAGEQRRLRDAHLVASHKLQRAAHHGSAHIQQAVVNPAGARVADSDRFGRDVGRGGGGGAGQTVVGRTRARQHDVGDADGLGRSDVLGAGTREHRLLAEVNDVASGDASGGGRDRGTDAAVVHPVDADVGGGQRGLGDVDGDATARGVDAVVGGVSTSQGQAGDGHRLVGPDVLVGDGAGAQAARRQ